MDTTTSAAILVVHTSCISDDNTIIDDDDDDDDDEVLSDMHGTTTITTSTLKKFESRWKQQQHHPAASLPLSCDFILLPEFPILDNNGAIESDGRNQYDEPPLIILSQNGNNNNDNDDEMNMMDTHHEFWKDALSYQPTRYEKKWRHRLDPCGGDNLVALNDLPATSPERRPSYLLTIASCSMDVLDMTRAANGDDDDIDHMQAVLDDDDDDYNHHNRHVNHVEHMAVFVSVYPSNFVFVLEELVVLDEVSMKMSLDLVGFTQLNVTFDLTYANQIIRESAQKAILLSLSSNHTRQQANNNTTNNDQNSRENESFCNLVENHNPWLASASHGESMFMPPTTLNPPVCQCECSSFHPEQQQRSEELAHALLQTLTANERGDDVYLMLMMCQVAIGVLISVLFVWMGRNMFGKPQRPYNRLPPKDNAVDPNGPAYNATTATCTNPSGSLQDNQLEICHEPNSDVLQLACASIAATNPSHPDQVVGTVPRLMDEQRHHVEQEPCNASSVAIVTTGSFDQSTCGDDAVLATPPRGAIDKQQFILKYDQPDDSIPEDLRDSPVGTSWKEVNRELGNEQIYDHNGILLFDASNNNNNDDTNDSNINSDGKTCSLSWTNQWLQNRVARQRQRRHKREMKQVEGRPVFVTPPRSAGDIMDSASLTTNNTEANVKAWSTKPSTASSSVCCHEGENGSTQWVDSTFPDPRLNLDEPTAHLLTCNSLASDFWGM